MSVVVKLIVEYVIKCSGISLLLRKKCLKYDNLTFGKTKRK